MFGKKKKFKLTAAILLLIFIYALHALYVIFAHTPSLELLSKNTISYSGLRAKVNSGNTRVSLIKVSLGTEENLIYPIYEESSLDKDFKEKFISIPLSPEDEAVKFIKKNKLESLYIYYSINYSNKFFDSDINKKIKISIDFEPPSIKSVKTDSYLYLGGIGYVTYETSSDTYSSYVDTGLDNKFYPITRINKDSISNLVYFTCGNKPCKNGKIKIIAEDLSGNSLVLFKKVKTLRNKKWKTSDIVIDLDFVRNKYNEIFNTNIETVSVDNFLELNLELRKKNNLEISSQTKKITKEPITLGKFFQLRNSKVFSRFSDKRNYFFDDMESSLMSTYHWGYDLSSIENAKVYASSEGVVSFLSNDGLGIYGKTIVINHGLGFYSLYSHLSEISVRVGDTVSSKVVIGKTGQSGLAFGDHLHFGSYIQGVPFDSNEIWDKKYFNQKVLSVYKNFINSKKINSNSEGRLKAEWLYTVSILF